MLLGCKSLQKSYGIDTILADVSFILNRGEKAAIVGVNGAGKTTLLKMLTGDLQQDSGIITKPKQIAIGYLPQIAELDSQNNIYEELILVYNELLTLEKNIRELERGMSQLNGEHIKKALNDYDKMIQEFENQNGYACESRVRGVIKGLGFSESEWKQPIWQLSGGQKTRVALGKLLLTEPDLLLLDEPTNSLDMESIVWLEEYLRSYKEAVIIVSHDRYFLDRTVSKIIEIENKKSKVYSGNYSFYARHKTEDRETAVKRYLDQQKEIRRQEAVIERLKSFNREKSVKRAESKEKRLDMLERIERPESVPDKMRFSITPRVQSGKDVLEVRDVSKYFSDELLFENISFSLTRGEKAALIGANGIGKTTLFKMIMSEIDFDSGYINKGVNVKATYYNQEHEGLDCSKSIFDDISDTYPRITSNDIRNVLAAFVFTGDDVFKQIGVLSGGEKSRVALAKIILSEANFLILDEPTNHLDMASKEILESSLKGYTGTLLYISHDRYFINNTATKVLEMDKSGVNVHLGNYDYYLEKKRQAQRASEPAEVSPSKGDRTKKKNIGSMERKRVNAQNKIEAEIERLDKLLAELEEKLSTEEVGCDAVLAEQYYNEKTEAELQQLELYEKWDELLS